MRKSLLMLGVCTPALMLGAMPASADMVFNRIASFAVETNIPADMDPLSESSSEIIAATDDGMTLVYTDSPLGVLGFIDITDPAAPAAGGVLDMDGEPTSVTIVGGKALIGVNTSESYTAPSGHLAVVDIASKSIEATCDLGGQPDALASARDGSFVAVAIENERDEDLDDGVIPQLPAGNVTIFPLTDGLPNCDGMIVADMTGLAEVAPSDPEPEFVDVNGAGHIVVTMQENNHLAIVDGATGEVVSHFSAGSVDLENIDTEEEGALVFTSSQEGRVREPDAANWIDDERFVTANEGDYKGGSRGFTIYNADGTVAYESGPSFEHAIVSIGHYPEARSGNKGVEPEGIEVGTYGDTTYIFVGAERSSIVGVYRDTGAEPELVQLLPSGIGPEGAVAIPSRNLFVTANETDLGEDGGARSHVMLYELAEGVPAYPQLVSDNDADGLPVGWGAISGMVANPDQPGILYAVNDSFYGQQPAIFTIDATQTPARIVKKTVVTRDGVPAQKLDLEGIAIADGGFWLASEGRTDRVLPHAIYMVGEDGAIEEEIGLPAELEAVKMRFGFEGVTTVGEGDDLTLWMAVQREWRDDDKGFVKLVSYTPASGTWGAVRYPLDPVEKGWIGLSEITAHGDHVYIVERDNQIGLNAKIKKLYRVALSEMVPAELGGELPVVTKEEVRDFIPDLKALNGFVVDKLEGFAIDADGIGYASTDNDGIDDHSGETYFWSIGEVK